MTFLSLIVLVAVLCTAFGSSKFEDYVKEFGKPWKIGTREWAERKAIFEERVKGIEAHNANPSKSYSRGINQFTTYTASEMNALLGAVPELEKHHTPKHARPHSMNLKPVSELPTEVDWRKKGVVSPVKNQGSCGSCWAFSTTETIESHVAIQTGQLYDLSPQQIASCTKNPNQCGGTGGCGGSMPFVAMDNLLEAGTGLTEEFQYCYNSYFGENFDCKAMNDESHTTAMGMVDFTSYVTTQNNYTELMNAVAQEGPISIVLDASTFHDYSGGIFDGCDPSKIQLNHAVQLVGYGEENGQKYWLVRNSWSPRWGEQGYIRMKRSDNDDDNCDVTFNAGRCSDDPYSAKACGTCGMMYWSVYPQGGKLYKWN